MSNQLESDSKRDRTWPDKAYAGGRNATLCKYDGSQLCYLFPSNPGSPDDQTPAIDTSFSNLMQVFGMR
jgi:hypothetical protein